MFAFVIVRFVEKGVALNHRVEESQLRIYTPLEDLCLYQWHTKTAKDYFCPVCGILPFRRPRDARKSGQ